MSSLQSHATCGTKVGSMSVHRLQWWPNIEPARSILCFRQEWILLPETPGEWRNKKTFLKDFNIIISHFLHQVQFTMALNISM